jgi:hypothetical protein
VEELDHARSCGAFDAFVTNDSFDDGYASLKAAISRFRPDIIPPPPPPGAQAGEVGGPSGSRPGRPGHKAPAPALILCGPAGGGREAVSAQLLARLPGIFVLPPRITDRKPPTPPAMGSTRGAPGATPAGAAGPAANAGVAVSSSSATAAEVVKSEVLAKLATSGQLALQWQDGAGAAVAVTVDSLRAAAAAGTTAGEICLVLPRFPRTLLQPTLDAPGSSSACKQLRGGLSTANFLLPACLSQARSPSWRYLGRRRWHPYGSW